MKGLKLTKRTENKKLDRHAVDAMADRLGVGEALVKELMPEVAAARGARISVRRIPIESSTWRSTEPGISSQNAGQPQPQPLLV
jgi:hypothetical protein